VTAPSGTIKVALAMDHPAQQFARAFEALNAQPDMDVRVLYWSAPRQAYDVGFGRPVAWDVELLNGYEWSSPAVRSAMGRITWLVGELRRLSPDVLVCYGWATPIARASITYCVLTRTPLLMYGDSTWQHPGRWKYHLLRSVALRILMRLCTGAVSTGTFNREFYIHHGLHPRRIWPGVCPADTGFFDRARQERGEHNELRAELRIGFAGKLIPRKGADELLRAAALLPQTDNWSVALVGDGPAIGELRRLATRLSIADRVAFHGFANTSEMPKLLADFDVLVVPSRFDMRVLVTIEAMAAGAAVIVSDATAVWGSGDLVEDGVTGLVYRSGDPAALAGQLHRLFDDPGFLVSLQRNGAARSASFGPAAFAQTMKMAILSSLSKRQSALRSG
jgi:glycosyltransferase involved in cell wall biosynthesis